MHFSQMSKTPTQHYNNILSTFASLPSLKGLKTIQNTLLAFDCETFWLDFVLIFSLCTSPNKTWSHLIPLQWLIMITTINKSLESFWHIAVEMRGSQTAYSNALRDGKLLDFNSSCIKENNWCMFTSLSWEYAITGNTAPYTGKRKR